MRTLHLIRPRRIPSRRRLVNTMPGSSLSCAGPKRLTDLPVMAERIEQTTDPPAVFVAHGPYFGSSGRDRLREHRGGIVHHQHEPRGAPAERLRAEIEMVRRLVSDPEPGVTRLKLSDDCAGFRFDSKQLARTERRLVEVDGRGTAPHGQHRRESHLFILQSTIVGARRSRAFDYRMRPRSSHPWSCPTRRRSCPQEYSLPMHRLRRMPACAGILCLASIPIWNAALRASGASYNDLTALFTEWRAFQQPKRVDGVPDYSTSAMSVQQRDL